MRKFRKPPFFHNETYSKTLMPKGDQCCGKAPHRFPFYSGDGGKACCSGKVFKTADACCKNDTIIRGGTCEEDEELPEVVINRPVKRPGLN